MNRTIFALMIAAGVALGGLAQAKLPPPTEAQKAAAAEKSAADKAAAAKEAELLGKYQDRAAANYKRNKPGGRPVSQSGR